MKKKMEKADYLIVGNSAAAIGAVEAIRSVDDEGDIVLVAREPHHTYSKPLISYLLGGDVEERNMFYRDADFYELNGVNTQLGVEVVRVDPEHKTVQTDDRASIAFDKLLIATGGKPIRPDVPGADCEGVFTLVSWDDARRIDGRIQAGGITDAVVVGGGLIGLKSVEALVARGLRVSVVELAPRILSATFDDVASTLAEQALAEAVVRLFCGTTVERVEQSDGVIEAVTLTNGQRVACQLLVFAIGVVPNIDIVRGTAVAIDRGILVDEHMKTSVSGIYAAGDVAQAEELFGGEKRVIAILPVAYRQGYVAGSNMAGKVRAYAPGMLMNAVEICKLPTISVGITDPRGDGYEVLSMLDEENSVYKKIVLRNNRIVGAIFVGHIDRAGIITGLARARIDVSSFKNLLLTDEFGLIALPADYRKHLVSGPGIEV